jgi:hypothetical protein
VVAVVLLGGEQEHAELRAVETPGIGGVDPGAADVLGRVRRDPSVDVRKPVEAAHRREPAVNRRRRQPAFFHPAAEELNVGTSRLQDGDRVVGCPLEEAP